jgi:hypothetical protein
VSAECKKATVQATTVDKLVAVDELTPIAFSPFSHMTLRLISALNQKRAKIMEQEFLRQINLQH